MGDRAGRFPFDADGIPSLVLGAAVAVGFAWGLPGADSWAADSISPRSCGLGAIAATYLPGQYHTYPPLQMALLTVVSLPWMALAAARVGMNVGALGDELIKPLYMTGIEVSARLVTAFMALGVLRAVTVFWTRLAGRAAGWVAGAVTATNAVFVYYAHTGNLEVPYLFWIAWALVEMDRVQAGERREVRALLCCAAAALTKDQAIAALLLPLGWALVVVPWAARRELPTRPALVRGVAASAAVYAVASGALTNPSGFARRVAFLLGPASQSWAKYPRGFHGALAMARDVVAATPHFTSWGVAALAAAGLGVAAGRARTLEGARFLLPLWAAASFTVFFTLGARRTEDRFLLPQAVFFLPYGALCLELAGARRGAVRAALALVGSAALLGALVGVASLDATLLADPRYEAERFLASLPAGAHVEVYGGPIFLPRVPPALVAARPGVEPSSERQHIPGVVELVDPAMDPRPRAPAAIVLATELSNRESLEPPAASLPFALAQYRDARSHALFRALADGSYGFERVLTAKCSVPPPLSCRSVHASTAGEVWIYAPRRAGPAIQSQSARSNTNTGQPTLP